VKISLAALLAAALLSGCITFSAYDSDTGESIGELVRRTNEVVADGDAGRLSLADSQQFLRQSQAQMHVLRVRDGYMSKRALATVNSLDKEYATLLARKRPLRSRDTSALRGTLFALQAMRSVGPVGRGTASTSSSSDTTSDPFENDAATKEECDRKDKKDRDDHHRHGKH
jgi:hypothetical protein